MTRWTDERLAKMKALHGDGLSASQIAKAIGVTRNAVIGKVARLGWGPIGGSKPTPPAKAPKRIAPPTRPSFGAIGLKAPAVKREGAGRNALHITEAKAVVGWTEPKHDEDLSKAVPLLARKFSMCAAPVAGQGDDALFCGHDVSEGSSYCPTHRARFCVPPTKTANEMARSLRRSIAA